MNVSLSNARKCTHTLINFTTAYVKCRVSRNITKFTREAIFTEILITLRLTNLSIFTRIADFHNFLCSEKENTRHIL